MYDAPMLRDGKKRNCVQYALLFGSGRIVFFVQVIILFPGHFVVYFLVDEEQWCPLLLLLFSWHRYVVLYRFMYVGTGYIPYLIRVCGTGGTLCQINIVSIEQTYTSQGLYNQFTVMVKVKLCIEQYPYFFSIVLHISYARKSCLCWSMDVRTQLISFCVKVIR